MKQKTAVLTLIREAIKAWTDGPPTSVVVDVLDVTVVRSCTLVVTANGGRYFVQETPDAVRAKLGLGRRWPNNVL